MKILGLIFTRNVSLETWIKTGLLEREIEIYKLYICKNIFDKIFLFTYGTNDSFYLEDLRKKEKIYEKIEVIGIPKYLNFYFGKIIYSFILSIINMKKIKKCTIIKTNQIDGAWSIILIKFLFNKKIIVRCGYILSIFNEKTNKNKILRNKCFKKLEKLSLNFSDKIVVSSKADKKYFIEEYTINEKKISQIYNYINLKKFKENMKFDFDKNNFVFVGRLTESKNIISLVESAKELGVCLDIYGDGLLKEKLKKIIGKDNKKIKLLGKIPNDELAKELRRYNYYILPSFIEGTPKTLLEAMASGLICIGSNIEGTNEIINKERGFLINGFDKESIKNTIKDIILLNSEKKSVIRKNGVKFIKENFSLEAYFKTEKEIIMELMNAK